MTDRWDMICGGGEPLSLRDALLLALKNGRKPLLDMVRATVSYGFRAQEVIQDVEDMVEDKGLWVTHDGDVLQAEDVTLDDIQEVLRNTVVDPGTVLVWDFSIPLDLMDNATSDVPEWEIDI